MSLFEGGDVGAYFIKEIGMGELLNKISADEVVQFVAKHFEFQRGCYFSESEPVLTGFLSSSAYIDDFYWNSYWGFKESDLSKAICELEPLFKAKNRELALYVDPTVEPASALSDLKKAGFEIEREIWMTAKDGIARTGNVSNIDVQVADQDNREDFLKVFSIAFGGEATTADGYGDLPPEYLSVLRDFFAGKGKPGIEYVPLVAYFNNEPVGCGSIHICGEYAGLYNVGTLPKSRKKGIGAAVSAEAVKIAKSKGVSTIFFQTQPGGSVQKFYEGLGCEVIFETAIAHKSKLQSKTRTIPASRP
jgi:ribosomal protein S18 acetylase RimI-like enzyme